MPYTIRRAAVIGAGTMGAGIAAHLANAGIPTLLLDMPKDGDRNAIVRNGVERMRKSRPPAFMAADRENLIAIGNIEDDLHRIKYVDWVLEAIIENVDAKRALWQTVEKLVSPSTIVTSNSSGIPMRLQVEGRSQEFRRRFLGTHFFNPPRYMHLLELIPTDDTDPAVLQTMRRFADHILGKGVVVAHDVPGFVANRVAAHAFSHVFRDMVEFKLTPDVVDAITGPLIGRPKSATFRTADLSGIDIFVNVSDNLAKATGEDFALPEAMRKVVERGWLGDKTGQGFYKKVRGSNGASTILTLNLDTMQYEDRGRIRLPELAPILALPTPQERLKALLALEGPLGEFTRRTTDALISYATRMIGVVADDPTEVDNALKWGYGWQLGPFDIVRELGTETLSKHLGHAVEEVPATPPPDGPIVLRRYKQQTGRIIQTNADASLIDVGEGVALLEFHSKANSLGQGVIEMFYAADKRVREQFVGLVVGNQGENFSVGADLTLVLQFCKTQDWDGLEKACRTFQNMVTGLRYAPYPVVVAPFNRTLGGGCEMSLWSDAVQASAELYMGLVETGVGLIPAGGGTTEMLVRSTEHLPPETDAFHGVKQAFQTIALATVSTSALDARNLRLLREHDRDRITMNPDRVIEDARTRVIALAPDYMSPPRRRLRVLGESAYANLCVGAYLMREGGYISAHDEKIARALARVLSGGTRNTSEVVDEQLILDLEREAFLQLAGTQETQQRIEHTLKTGKPLRN